MSYGMDPRGLENVTRILQRFVDEKKMAGISMYIARDGVEYYKKTFGYMDVENKRPVAANAIYRVASMTKPTTMVGFMKLYEQGLFRLKDPVYEYIPEFKNQKVAVKDADGSFHLEDPKTPVTIWNLLTMTSGMPYGERRPSRATPASLAMADFLDAGKVDGLGTLDYVKAVASNVPLAFHPGEEWLYGFSHDVVGALIEVISGKRFSDYQEENIFAPLGMKDTGFYVPVEKADRSVKFYTLDGTLTPADSAVKYAANERPAFESGGGGLFSTIDDYAKFAQMLCNGGTYGKERIIGRKTLELMTSDQLNDLQKKTVFRNWYRLIGAYSYGLGMRVMVDPVKNGYNGTKGEFGWDGATGTWFMVDPKERLVAILFQQSNPAGHEWYEPILMPTIYSAVE